MGICKFKIVYSHFPEIEGSQRIPMQTAQQLEYSPDGLVQAGG